jgi:ubiquitin C-terminal hydrolase
VIVTKNLWNFLSQTYGGGPSFKRKMYILDENKNIRPFVELYFMNSIFQCLMKTPLLDEILLQKLFLNHLNKNKTLL